MNADRLRFVVEQAGCETCSERVRSALEPLLTIETIEIDAAADSATIVGRSAGPVSPVEVDEALARASSGSNHAYRIGPGTWSSGVAAN